MDLRLFGTLELSAQEGAERRVVPVQPKRAAVLAYLAAARPARLHRRDTLLSMFWPESSAEHARNALSKALHHLRQALGSDALVTSGDEELGLSREHVWCDVTAFEDAADRGDLEEAAALYTGHLMSGFHVDAAPDFEHWLHAQRERLRLKACEVAWALCDGAAAAGDTAAAERWARKAVVWAPEDEEGLRRLLMLLQLHGNRAAAVQAYEDFAARLDTEYGIEPSDPSRELIAAIRDGSLESAPLDTEAHRVAVGSMMVAAQPIAILGPESVTRAPGASIDGPRRDGPIVSSRTTVRRRRVLMGAAALGIAWVAYSATSDAVPDAVPPDAVPNASIAVLPFVNMSSDPEQDYFSDGLAEGVLNALAQVGDLHVTGRSSSFSLRGQALDVRQVAARLGVAHVLEGSVQKVGDRVRITAQLIEAETDRHLWSEQFDRELELSDVFAVQDEIAAAIVDALLAAMGLETAGSIRESQLVSAEAHDQYLRGLQASGLGTTAGYEAARSFFEQAVDLEPTYAMAYARLARTLRRLARSGTALWARAREAANEAIRLDPTIGLSYTVLSRLDEFEGRAKAPLTLELREKGYELTPNDPYVTFHYGRALEARGQVHEALELMGRAVDLAPLDIERRTDFGDMLTQRGRPADGLREHERATDLAPDNPRAWRYRATSTRWVGDLVSSVKAYRRVHDLDPDSPRGAYGLAENYMRLGDLEAARVWLDEATRRSGSSSSLPEARWLYLNGQEEKSAELLLRALENRPSRGQWRLMRIVVAGMMARSAFDEAERFLLRQDDRLAAFKAGPVLSYVGFPPPPFTGGQGQTVGSPHYAARALQDVYKKAGRTAEADALADRLDFWSWRGFLSTVQVDWTARNHHTEALWHMRRGRHSDALSELERAVEKGFVGDGAGQGWQFAIRDHFIFEELRERPRFKALIETIEAKMSRRRAILAEQTEAWIEELGAVRSAAAAGN